jgi:hypothetical protein
MQPERMALVVGVACGVVLAFADATSAQPVSLLQGARTLRVTATTFAEPLLEPINVVDAWTSTAGTPSATGVSPAVASAAPGGGAPARATASADGSYAETLSGGGISIDARLKSAAAKFSPEASSFGESFLTFSLRLRPGASGAYRFVHSGQWGIFAPSPIFCDYYADLELRDLTSGLVVADLAAPTDIAYLRAVTLTLDASREYEMVFTGRSVCVLVPQAPVGWDNTSELRLNATLVPVPSPGALMVLAGGAVLAARRRRGGVRGA